MVTSNVLADSFSLIWQAGESFKAAARCCRHSALREELNDTAKVLRSACDRLELLLRRDKVTFTGTPPTYALFQGHLSFDKGLADQEKDSRMTQAAIQAFIDLELQIVELESRAHAEVAGTLWSLRQTLHQHEDLVQDLRRILTPSTLAQEVA